MQTQQTVNKTIALQMFIVVQKLTDEDPISFTDHICIVVFSLREKNSFHTYGVKVIHVTQVRDRFNRLSRYSHQCP